MDRFNFYWMANAGRWYLLPAFLPTIEHVDVYINRHWKKRPVLSLEVYFLNRWCAVEVLL